MILRVLCALGLLGFVLAPAQAADKADRKQAKDDPAALFKKLDANNDGKVSKEEFKNGHFGEKGEKLFERLDANNDGSVSADEFKRLADRKAGGAQGDLAEQFKKLDANKDGKLSKEEVGKSLLVQDNPQRLDKLMQRLDTNNDGSLSEEEFKKLGELRKKQPKS